MSNELNELDAATRDVYAHFGLAYYFSECVFQGLVNVLATDGVVITRGSVEERMKLFSASTLGPLVDAAKSTIPHEHHSTLDLALKRRNFLAHGFWYQRVHQMQTLSALAELQRELVADQGRFRYISDLADEIVTRRLRLAGISEDAFAAAYEQAKTAAPDPIPDRSLPKSKQALQVLEAWVTFSGGLVLKDDAEQLWQLGERGLCWYVGEPETSWTHPSFSDLLPASVVARPKNANSWNYSLSFSTGFELRVSIDEQDQMPRMSVHRASSPR